MWLNLPTGNIINTFASLGFKGSVPREFRLQVFHESVSPTPMSNFEYIISAVLIICAVLNFFKKFSEIFTAQGAPPVSLTPVANVKIFHQKSFNYFVWTPLGSTIIIV
jgi:hypothetical protein